MAPSLRHLVLLAATAAATPVITRRQDTILTGVATTDGPSLTIDLQIGGGLATPTPEPSPVNEDWENAKCDIPSLTSGTANPYVGWNECVSAPRASHPGVTCAEHIH